MPMQKMSKQKGQPQGLTLIELLIVIAILGIMAGMTMSALGKYIPDYRLQSAARELYANMHKAKMEAIKRNTDVKVDFDVNNSQYSISFEDKDENTVNINVVNLSKYDNYVSYGIGNADYKNTNELVSYQYDKACFNSQGTTCSVSYVGYVYLTNTKGNTFAVGSLNSGVILLSKWINGKWSE
ncbi:MAG: prepilin-type N-terminal cleavage/methylation domain-containing protein [Desulfovermiculus sp.]|nr:prepilin-type N-terminal cleavage/methylation domain-containing protein [Desulfovermiculus sp.]